MSDNAIPTLTLTPAQAHNILTQVAAHKTLQLNLEEHGAVQQALQVLKPAEVTLNPKLVTV